MLPYLEEGAGRAMKRFIRRIALIVGVVVAAALMAVTSPVMAAGPRIMIVYGRPLARPVIFSNWGENEELMVSSNDSMSVTNVRLKGRPSLRMALFWGTEWVQYAKRHPSLAALRPGQANQFARFYPAYGAAPALLAFDAIPGPYTSLIRRIGPAGIAVLARHGIPVRLPVRARASSYRLIVVDVHGRR